MSAVPDMVVSGTLCANAIGSIASICVPSIEATTAVTSPSDSARSNAFTAPSGEVPVSVTANLGCTPAGGFCSASSAPLRWLPPSAARKPVTGTSTGMSGVAGGAAMAGAPTSSAAAIPDAMASATPGHDDAPCDIPSISKSMCCGPAPRDNDPSPGQRTEPTPADQRRVPKMISAVVVGKRKTLEVASQRRPTRTGASHDRVQSACDYFR